MCPAILAVAEGKSLTVAGQISVTQGPLGVAFSARRVQPRPGSAAIESALEARSANLEGTPSRAPAPQRDPKENPEKNQEPVAAVSSGTLFETSRLAALMPMDEGQQFISARSAPEPWQPPYSSFHLRDRSV